MEKLADKMKVCLLNDSFPPVIDGVANAVKNYADIIYQDELGSPFVVTPDYPDVDDSGLPYPVLRYRSLDTTKIVAGYRAGVPFSGTLLHDIVSKKPDVIHTHCPAVSTILARELKPEVSAPIIFTYHTKFDVDIARAVKMKLLQESAIKVLVSNVTAADEVWVVSKGAGDNLKSLGYEGEVVVMDNGVDFPKGRTSKEDVDQISTEYHLPDDVPVFLFVGRLMWYKGLRIIVDALKKLDLQNIDFRMVFIGKGADSEALEQYVVEEGLQDKCLFPGPVYDRERLRAWNTRADLFLFPSTYDTNGLVVREAAACGLASLVIKDSCAAEGITDCRNGYFCEENPDSMAQVLGELVKDKSKLADVGQHAMDEIYMSWQDSVHRAFERYQVVIDRKKSGQIQKKSQLLTDEFYSATGEMLIAMKQSRLQARSEYFQFIEEYLRMKKGIKTVHDKMELNMQSKYEQIDQYFEESGKKINQFLKDRKETAKDYLETLERYL